MGVNPKRDALDGRHAAGRSLYGTLPDQLADETSFVRQLQAILRVRSHYGIATSRQVDIPEVSTPRHAGPGPPAPDPSPLSSRC